MKKTTKTKKGMLVITHMVIKDLLMKAVPDIIKIQEMHLNPNQKEFTLEIDLLQYANDKFSYFIPEEGLDKGSPVIWGGADFQKALQEEGLWIVEGTVHPYFDDAAMLDLQLKLRRQAFISIEPF